MKLYGNVLLHFRLRDLKFFSVLSMVSFSFFCFLFLSSLLVFERHNTSKPERFTCKIVPFTCRLWVIRKEISKNKEKKLNYYFPLFTFHCQCSALIWKAQGVGCVSQCQPQCHLPCPQSPVPTSLHVLCHISPVWELLLEPKSGSWIEAKPSLICPAMKAESLSLVLMFLLCQRQK